MKISSQSREICPVINDVKNSVKIIQIHQEMWEELQSTRNGGICKDTV